MTDKKNQFTPGNRFGLMRSQAKSVYAGPQSIEADLEDSHFWGWPVLYLEVRHAHLDQVESRSLYANLENESQRIAILRSVYWDGQSMKKAIYRGEQRSLILPARFVRVPISQVLQWLTSFDNVSLSLRELGNISEDIDIKRIRIERDYISSIFELAWQNEVDSFEGLAEKWNSLWKELTKVLQQPSQQNLEEHFRIVAPEFTYDLDNYVPERYLVK